MFSSKVNYIIHIPCKRLFLTKENIIVTVWSGKLHAIVPLEGVPSVGVTGVACHC